MSILSIIPLLSQTLSQRSEINKEIDPSSNFLINNITITAGTMLVSLGTAFLVYRCFKSQQTMPSKTSLSAEPSKTSLSVEELRNLDKILPTTSCASVFNDEELITIVDAIVKRLLDEKLWEFEGAFRESGSITWLKEAQQKLENAASKKGNLVDVINSLEKVTGNNLIGLLKRMCTLTKNPEIFKDSQLLILLENVDNSKVCLLKKKNEAMYKAFPASKAFF